MHIWDDDGQTLAYVRNVQKPQKGVEWKGMDNRMTINLSVKIKGGPRTPLAIEIYGTAV